MSCFPKPLKEENERTAREHNVDSESTAAAGASSTKNTQYDNAVKNIHAHEVKDYHQLRLIAFRRRSFLKQPGLNDNLRLWLSIEVGELAIFEEKQIKRIVSDHVEATTPDGENIIHVAAQRGNTHILRLALRALPKAKRSAFINARSITNEPPLLLAAQNGHRDAVKLLLRYGADVNNTNASGETGLYLACYHGFREVVIELLRHPAVDVDLLSEESASAYGVCLAKRHLDLARRVRWRSMWGVFRLLWLARRKNTAPECPLARLPDTFITSLITRIVTAEVAHLSAVNRRA